MKNKFSTYMTAIKVQLVGQEKKNQEEAEVEVEPATSRARSS